MMKAFSLFLSIASVQAFQTPVALFFQDQHATILKAIPNQQQTSDNDFVTSTFDEAKTGGFSLEDLKNKMPDNLKIPENIQMPDLSNVMASFSEGEFGTRGEAYVAAQAVLMLAVVFGGHLPFLDLLLAVSGPTLLVGGLAVLVLSVSDLGDGLTPFTTPSSKGSLTTTGLYEYVRHPMYAGLLASLAGLSLTSDSAARLLLTGVLAVVLNIKTDMEEAELQKIYPGDFAQYQQSVTGKFFPNELWEQIKPGNDSTNMSP